MSQPSETESMTLKRLEVALRNKDEQLLKDAAYKLHEKYHTGHDFKLIEELKEILLSARSSAMPQDILDVLCPTIEEIISISQTEYKPFIQHGEKHDEDYENRVKQYSFNFGGSERVDVKDSDEAEQQPQQEEYRQEEYREEAQEGSRGETQEEEMTLQNAEIQELSEPEREYYSEENIQNEKIAIFYNETKSGLDNSLIKNYRAKLELQKPELTDELSELLDIIDSDIPTMQDLLINFGKMGRKISFITTSQNQNLTKYLSHNNIPYQVCLAENTYKENPLCNFIPIFGLSNLFTCNKCDEKFLNTQFDFKALTVKCPKCGAVAYPEIYSTGSAECNMHLMQSALEALCCSKIWVLLDLSVEDSVWDLLRIIYKASKPDKVYLLSSDNRCKGDFLQINEECKIYSDYTNIEELFTDFRTREGSTGVLV